MGFSSLDKGKKIKIIVAAVGLLVGGVFILNYATDDKLKDTVLPPVKPEAPKLDTEAQKAYKRQKEEQKQAEEAGTSSTAGG